MGDQPDPGEVVGSAIDGLLEIRVCRPGKGNSYTPAMIEQLARAYTLLEQEETLRCAVLWAHGEDFTTGLDLRLYAPLFARGETGVPPDCIDPFALRGPLRRKPVVVAIQGRCFTHGIELALAADIVVAESGAQFVQLEVQRGIMPAGGATVRLVQRAGWGSAMRWLLTGDAFDANEAWRMGLVQEIVDPGRSREHALKIARRIAQAAPLAVQAVRMSGYAALEAGREQAELEALARRQSELAATADAQEGVRAFRDRREPVFMGR